MAQRGLGQSGSSQKGSEEGKDPLKEAQDFSKSMAAKDIIQSEVDKSKASARKAEAEAEEAKAKAARAQSGNTGSQEAVKVTGRVDLGDFNYQDILKQQSDDLKELKREADEQAARQAGISDDLRERLHAQEMLVLKTSFDAQMQVLTKMIETNASKGGFMEQYNGMMEIAKTLGFSQPQLAGDISSQVALKKMEFEQSRELRRMAREDKRADREFQRQLNMDADEREGKKAEQAREAKRDDMFNKAPQMIGGAIAQGLLANQGTGRRVAQEPTEEAPSKPQAQKGHHVEAGWGDSGEVECPGCSQPVAIGPTARTAVCANCGERVSIKRVGERPSREEEE